jgi:hypothetical protein
MKLLAALIVLALLAGCADMPSVFKLEPYDPTKERKRDL